MEVLFLGLNYKINLFNSKIKKLANLKIENKKAQKNLITNKLKPNLKNLTKINN